jgi:hypothetical protein
MLEDRLNGHLSRDFARLGASHAICNDVEIRIGRQRIEVLVVAPYTAGISETEGSNHKEDANIQESSSLSGGFPRRTPTPSLFNIAHNVSGSTAYCRRFRRGIVRSNRF